MPHSLKFCVYSRSDKHLISKMEKPKVSKHFLELFGGSMLQFVLFRFLVLVFSNCLFGIIRTEAPFYFIPHFSPQVVGGGFPPILV